MTAVYFTGFAGSIAAVLLLAAIVREVVRRERKRDAERRERMEAVQREAAAIDVLPFGVRNRDELAKRRALREYRAMTRNRRNTP